MKNYKIIHDKNDVFKLIDELKHVQLLALDTETNGLNYKAHKVIGISLSWTSNQGVYIVTHKWNKDIQKLEQYMPDRVIRELLHSLKGKKLIMHNGSFDCRMIYGNYGINLTEYLYCDTILLKHTIDEERPFGLKETALKYAHEMGIYNVANQEQLDLKESIKANGGSITQNEYELYKADVNKIGLYACADTDLTLKLYYHLSKKLREEQLEKFFYEEEVMPLYKEVTIPMEMNGIKLDVDLIKATKIEIENDIAILHNNVLSGMKHLLTDFERWFYSKNYNKTKTGNFAKILAELTGVNLPKTASGSPSLSKKALCSLDESEPLLQYINNDILDPSLELEVYRKWHTLSTNSSEVFNINSKNHLKHIFFDILKEEPLSFTDGDQPQVDEDFLDHISSKYVWAKHLVDFNKLNKLRSTYMVRFLEQEFEGHFYPSFKQFGTISGRYGSDLQQLPRVKEEGEQSPLVLKYTNKIREFFVAGSDYNFIDADYESLEPKVFAAVCADPGLARIFSDGLDFYSEIAIKTENIQNVSALKKADNYLGKLNKPARNKAKAYSLGIPYGMSGYALAKKLEIQQYEGEILVELYLNAFPKLKQWMHDSEEFVKQHGYIKSAVGRIRHMPEVLTLLNKYGNKIMDPLYLKEKYGYNKDVYENAKSARQRFKNYMNNAKNFQIQSLSASIVNRAALAISRYMKSNNIEGLVVAQIHDQLIVKVRSQDSSHMAKVVRQLMEEAYPLSIKLVAPAEIGTNFADAH